MKRLTIARLIKLAEMLDGAGAPYPSPPERFCTFLGDQLPGVLEVMSPGDDRDAMSVLTDFVVNEKLLLCLARKYRSRSKGFGEDLMDLVMLLCQGDILKKGQLATQTECVDAIKGYLEHNYQERRYREGMAGLAEIFQPLPGGALAFRKPVGNA